MQLHDVRHALLEGTSGLTIQRTQEIPDEYLAGLKEERQRSSAPAGNFHRFASVPVAVIEKWLREGFDALKASPREVMQRLSSEDLGSFITTNKRL